MAKEPKEAVVLNLLAETEEAEEEPEVVPNKAIAKEVVQDSGPMSSKTKKADKTNKMFSRPREPET